MSQTKAQLIQPIGIVTASTIQVSGVVTATTLVGDVTGTVTGLSTTTANLDVGIVTTSGMVGDVTGSASSIFSGNNIVAGVVTATKFTGNTSGRAANLADGTNANVGIFTATSFIGNLTGNAASLSNTDSQLNLGIVTATNFAGNFTGIGSGLTGTPNVVAGVVTSTFVGNFTGIGSGLSGTPNVRAGVVTASSFIGDFTGIGSGLSGTPNVTAGVVTASSFIGNFTGHASGLTGTPDVTAGLVTASSLLGNFTGFASGITGTPNITAGVITATAFAGNFTGIGSGLTGTPDYTAGIVTASSFIGNFTGIGSGLTGTPSFTAGIVTASSFIGNFTGIGSGLTGTPSFTAGIVTASSFLGNFTGVASGITGSPNITVGIMTGTLNGDGSNLTGIAATAFVTNNVTANGSNTTIDLSNGDNIILTQTANTTIAFSNVSTSHVISILRANGTGTITWPNAVSWSGGVAPTLIENPRSSDYQQFNLLTRDGGTTWFGWENLSNDPQNMELYVWGNNVYGEMMLNFSQGAKRSSPTQVPGTNWSSISNSSNNEQAHISFAGKSDGTLWVAGSPKEDGNSTMRGITGLNNQVRYSSPVQIPGTTWSGVVARGNQRVMATKTDGTLWIWGRNQYGELGVNDRTDRSSPVQVPGTWSTSKGRLAVGPQHNFAIKSDGTLWTWGQNNTGNMAVNQPSNYRRSSPVQVGSDSTWRTVVCDPWNNNIATKTDGTLWSWGYNGNGNLGLNDTTRRSSPTQIPGTTWSEAITTGNRNAQATKTDGTLWSWGFGGNGLNGQGNNTQYSSPKQIPGTNWGTDFHSLGATGYGKAALKTDGTLWTWGQNEVGQLGHNNRTERNEPYQVPGTNWAEVAGLSAGKGFYALKTTD